MSVANWNIDQAIFQKDLWIIEMDNTLYDHKQKLFNFLFLKIVALMLHFENACYCILLIWIIADKFLKDQI